MGTEEHFLAQQVYREQQVEERLRAGSGKNVQRSAESKQKVRWEEKPLWCGVAAARRVWRSCGSLG